MNICRFDEAMVCHLVVQPLTVEVDEIERPKPRSRTTAVGTQDKSMKP